MLTKKLTDERKRSKGFSLLEILVAMALLSVLAVAFITFLNNASKGQKNVQNAVDFDIIKSGLTLVTSTKACDNAFRNADNTKIKFTFTGTPTLGSDILTGPLSVAKIFHGNTTIAELGASVGGGMNLEKMAFTSAVYNGIQREGSVDYKVFTTTLALEAKKQDGSLGAIVLKAPLYTFRVLVADAAGGGTLEKCSVSEASSSIQSTTVDIPNVGDVFSGNLTKLAIPNPYPGKKILFVALTLESLISQRGFSAGEEYVLENYATVGFYQRLSFTASTIYLYVGSNSASYYILDKEYGQQIHPTGAEAAKWKLKLKVFAEK